MAGEISIAIVVNVFLMAVPVGKCRTVAGDHLVNRIESECRGVKCGRVEVSCRENADWNVPLTPGIDRIGIAPWLDVELNFCRTELLRNRLEDSIDVVLHGHKGVVVLRIAGHLTERLRVCPTSVGDSHDANAVIFGLLGFCNRISARIISAIAQDD